MSCRVLVPVDLSLVSRSALGHARLLAEVPPMDAEESPGVEPRATAVELLHVLPEPPDPETPLWTGTLGRLAELQSQRSAVAQKTLQDWAHELRLRWGLRVEGHVEVGPIPATIARRARRLPADVVVLATHGRSGLSRLLLGGVAARLLPLSPCPVLVARGGAETIRPPRRVAVAVDESPHAARAFRQAAHLAHCFGAPLDVVHVWEGPFSGATDLWDAELAEQARGSLLRDFAGFLDAQPTPRGLEIRRIVRSGDVNPELHGYLEEASPDLLVLGTHGRRGFHRWLLGSVAEAAVRYAPCATLVVPEPPSQARSAVPRAEPVTRAR